MNVFEILKKGFLSKSVEDTYSFAKSFLKEIPKDSFISLSGDLGSGKTAFVKGLGAGLGIKEAIKSPSFNICSIYKEGLVHIDAYRLESYFDSRDFLIDELATNPSIICVEWPEKIAHFIPEDAIKLNFSIEKNSEHLIRLA